MANGDYGPNNGRDPLRKVVDSTILIAFARVFMPVALAVIGWFMVNSFNDLKDSNNRLWTAVSKLTDISHSTVADVAVLKAKTDDMTQNVNRLSDKVDKLSTNGH